MDPRRSLLKIMSRFLPLLLVLVAGSSSPAATITVMQDGSGDFVEIQPALDAVASGDTLLIGPGEFTQLNPSYIPGYAWDVDVCAYVHVPALTIIGAGAGATVLGPTAYPGGGGLTFSPKCLVWLEGSERYIQGITFRNCYDGIHVTNGPVFIKDCEFVGNRGVGIIWQSDVSGGLIRNCRMSSNSIGSFGFYVVGYGSDMIIENCEFDGVESYLATVDNVNIIDCEMKNARVGLQLAASASAEIHGCHFHDFSIAGLELSAVAPHVDIYDSIIEGAIASVLCEAESTLFASGCEFYGGYDSVFWFQNSGPAVVQGCHLIRNGPLAINVYYQHIDYGQVVHDFTRNFWGTTDADQVADWIWDGNDDPSLHATVLYQPMANGPVGSETTSWGDLKALWR